jgi:hypothetical protein
LRTTGNAEAARPSGFARYAAVVAAAAVLLLAPGIAQAGFTSEATDQMSAATLSLAQPAGTVATSSCNNKDLTLTFTSYGNVPRATAFRIEIFRAASDTTPQLVVDRAQNDLSPITVRMSGGKAQRPYNVRGLYSTVGGNTWLGLPLPGTTVSC